jgi:hypothetical protein
MEAPTINWVAGWASDLSLWQAEIQKAFPNYRHCFFTWNATLPAGHETSVWISWSLGAQNVYQSKPMGRHIWVNPALNFCKPDHGWKPRILNRMIQALALDKNTVLENFAQGLACPEVTTWLEHAKTIQSTDLITGLEKLRDFSHSGDLVGAVIVGAQDQITKPIVQQEFANISLCPHAGHWPLHPEILQSIHELL